jgi:hypothetical protein
MTEFPGQQHQCNIRSSPAPKNPPFDKPPRSSSNAIMNPPAPSLIDFFAGSGLVTQGAKHACVPV